MPQTLEIRQGKTVRYSQTLDDFRRYLTDTPTPENLAATLRTVDEGDIAAMTEIATEIEAKDAHIQAIAELRRQSVTELEWSIEPRDPDDQESLDVAAFVQDTLDECENWPETLEHFAGAIGPGVAVTELVWDRSTLRETNDVPGHRLVGHTDNPNLIGVMTDDHRLDGIPANLGKYAVHLPKPRAGFPLYVTQTRASVWPWLIKHHGLSDWVAFSEAFGTPLKHYTYGDTTSQEARDDLEKVAKHAGPDAYVITHEDIKLSLLEAAKGDHPGEKMNEWADKKLSILWLGQTLTTDTTGVGSFALGKVHENVKASITLHDVKTERRTIGRYIIAPVVRRAFPKGGAPMPFFKRRLIETRNLDAERLNLEKLRYADEAKMPIDLKDRYELLSLPMPKNIDREADHD